MANRRFEMHQYRQVIFRMQKGESDRTIAKSGIMGRAKCAEVRQLALKNGWLKNEALIPQDDVLARVFDKKTRRPGQESLILPFKDKVEKWHTAGICGTTIHRALMRNHGFGGSYSCVRRFLQKLEAANPRTTCILDFEPGEAAQVDFGTGPVITDVFTGEVFKTWIFVMTLCFSRHQYAEIVLNQTVETWLGAHRRAFEFFNGIPAKMIIDNAKCAIIRACYHDPEVQRSYAEAAEGYGFLISPCPPRDPKKKGRVESGVKYVKNSFVPLRTFRSLADANGQLRKWVLGEAGNRIHGTTRERPLTRFEEIEKDLLRPLPDVPPELATWTRVKVHGNCHVQFEKASYSVPYRLVRRSLWLKATETTVKLFHDLELVAVHPRLRKPGARSTVDDHLPPEALAYKMRDPQWCLKKAREVGPSCHRLIQTLFADRVLDNLRAAQGVISLKADFGGSRLEKACARTLHFGNPRYRAVKSILKKGLDQIPLEEDIPGPLPSTYTDSGRFLRPGDMLH